MTRQIGESQLNPHALLLLGMLRVQSQHGYRINEFLERNAGTTTAMKKATAYAVLDRLCQDGYVTAQVEQEGRRPPRKVYSITPRGENLFFDLLRRGLGTADRFIFDGDEALMFVDNLPPDEARRLLEHRLAEVEEQLTKYAGMPSHGEALGVTLAIGHREALLRAESAWLTGLIDRLKSAT